ACLSPPLLLSLPPPPTPQPSPLSLHDALPISDRAWRWPTGSSSRTVRAAAPRRRCWWRSRDCSRGAGSRCSATTCPTVRRGRRRSEEHTSELQSRRDLVCRLLLEKKKDVMLRS